MCIFLYKRHQKVYIEMENIRFTIELPRTSVEQISNPKIY